MDDATIRAFLEDDYPRLVRAVALVTGSPAIAEDAVQEAVVRAWERSERGEPIESLDRWVAAVAMNLSRSGLRHLRVERLAGPRLVATATVHPPEAEVVDVRRALASLPRRQREVAVLRYFLDLSTDDIAAAMRTSPGTVKSQLAKARAHLAEALALRDEPERETDHADA